MNLLLVRIRSFPNFCFQITEIQSNKQFPPSLFASKVYLLYNILQTALSCYSTNLRNFLDRCIPPKITDLINSIVEVTMICVEGKLFDQDDFVIQVRFSVFTLNDFFSL